MRRRRVHLNRRRDGLRQPIQYVRSQRTRALEEVTEHKDFQAHLGGNLLQGPSAPMNGAAEVSTQRIFRGRLVE